MNFHMIIIYIQSCFCLKFKWWSIHITKNEKYYDENNSKYYICENGTYNLIGTLGNYLSHNNKINDKWYYLR